MVESTILGIFGLIALFVITKHIGNISSKFLGMFKKKDDPPIVEENSTDIEKNKVKMYSYEPEHIEDYPTNIKNKPKNVEDDICYISAGDYRFGGYRLALEYHNPELPSPGMRHGDQLFARTISALPEYYSNSERKGMVEQAIFIVGKTHKKMSKKMIESRINQMDPIYKRLFEDVGIGKSLKSLEKEGMIHLDGDNISLAVRDYPACTITGETISYKTPGVDEYLVESKKYKNKIIQIINKLGKKNEVIEVNKIYSEVEKASLRMDEAKKLVEALGTNRFLEPLTLDGYNRSLDDQSVKWRKIGLIE